jgi:hypothetical protein
MKTIIMLLTAVLLITACTTTENTETPAESTPLQQSQTTESPTTTTEEPPIVTTPPVQDENFDDFDEMPVPFEHMGSDANWFFYERYDSPFREISTIDEVFVEYLASSLEKTDSEVIDIIVEKWGDITWYGVVVSGELLKSSNVFWYIVTFDIPDDVVISAIEIHNDYWNEQAELYEGNRTAVFSDEGIAALLTRDEAIITAQFATEHAIVIGDRAYSPYWIYLHTPADYQAAGITPEMLAEKLPLYAEFGFTDEAREAFENKLTEFVGVEVSLARE